MPWKSKVACRHPGCPELVPQGQKYCEKHQCLHKDEARPAAERGYGSRWQKARKIYLQRHPLCERCMAKGIYREATVVDHIVPHRGNRELFWDEKNWQALCKKCHDTKTMTEDRYKKYSYEDR